MHALGFGGVRLWLRRNGIEAKTPPHCVGAMCQCAESETFPVHAGKQSPHITTLKCALSHALRNGSSGATGGHAAGFVGVDVFGAHVCGLPFRSYAAEGSPWLALAA